MGATLRHGAAMEGDASRGDVGLAGADVAGKSAHITWP